MDLRRLKLQNFKGTKEFEFTTDGEDINIYGAEESGKTTIKDGYHWLLFDKNSKNKSVFGMKPWDANGEPVHHLETVVEADFLLNESTVTLSKKLLEKWTSKKGSPIKTFSGNTIEYRIAGVKRSEAEFKAAVEAVIGGNENTFRLLSDPEYFCDVLKWNERRKLITDIVGGVDVKEVILASEVSLTPLMDKLVEYQLDIDDFKAVREERKADLGKALKAIPISVNEVQRGIKELGVKPEKTVEELEQMIRDALSTGGNGQELVKASEELTAATVALSKWLNADAEVRDAALETAKHNRDAHQEVMKEVSGQIYFDQQKYEGLQFNLNTMKKQLEELRTQCNAIRNAKFVEETVCFACGTELAKEKIEASRAAWQEDKDKRFKAKQDEGIALRAKYDSVKAEAEELASKFQTNEADLLQMRKTEEELGAAVEAAYENLKAFKEDPEYLDLIKVRDAKQTHLETLQGGSGEGGNTEELEQKLKVAKEYEKQAEKNEEAQARIAELEGEQDKLAEEYEDVAEDLRLVGLYDKVKAEMMQSRINGMFELALIKVSKLKVDGEYEECCEVMSKKGVPWNDMSNSQRHRVGLDIIRTLCDHYDVYPPVFVDNREGSPTLPRMENQIISLIVSPEDEKLRVE